MKILNFKFEYDDKKKNVAFIGISNWILDASKMNRGFNLSVPEIHENESDLDETCKEIVESINKDLYNNEEYKVIFEALYKAYKDYKEYFEKNNEKKNEDENNKDNENKNKTNKPQKKDLNILCHGSRDFYFLIKNVAFSLNDKLKENKKIAFEDIIKIVSVAIERNFDGFNINDMSSSAFFKEKYTKRLNKITLVIFY